jgi:hypothetical protein
LNDWRQSKRERGQVTKDELKVPKRENFSLAFFALGEPTWVCDLGSAKKSRIFYQMISDFEGLRFFAEN